MPNHQPHRKLIYIAGPMSGLPDCNRPAFHAAALNQLERGNIPLNPAILPDGLTQPQYMAICIEMVKMADELIMLPGWRDSLGANAEFHLAMKCGKVIRQVDDGFTWYPATEDEAANQIEAKPRSHQWDESGERCELCGDKDWMGTPHCDYVQPELHGQEAHYQVNGGAA